MGVLGMDIRKEFKRDRRILSDAWAEYFTEHKKNTFLDSDYALQKYSEYWDILGRLSRKYGCGLKAMAGCMRTSKLGS